MSPSRSQHVNNSSGSRLQSRPRRPISSLIVGLVSIRRLSSQTLHPVFCVDVEVGECQRRPWLTLPSSAGGLCLWDRLPGCPEGLSTFAFFGHRRGVAGARAAVASGGLDVSAGRSVLASTAPSSVSRLLGLPHWSLERSSGSRLGLAPGPARWPPGAGPPPAFGLLTPFRSCRRRNAAARTSRYCSRTNTR